MYCIFVRPLYVKKRKAYPLFKMGFPATCRFHRPCILVARKSVVNAVFLFVMVIMYYLSITAYCTPYNALLPELGHNQQERLNISTVISFTFIAGTAVAYLAPVIWGTLIPVFGRVGHQ